MTDPRVTDPRVNAPRIALPVRLSDGASDPRVAGANRILHDVADLIERAGGEVVYLDAVDLGGIDGLVLPGGGDIDPARYGGSRIEALYDVNPRQDELDLGLADTALADGIPILGVCRGLQVLNVAYGGTLIEDLSPTATPHTTGRTDDGLDITWAWHDVAIDSGSLLGRHAGMSTLRVASGHHQGIGVLGAGLTATATAEDGLIEAFERREDAVIAVQWHPEAAGTETSSALAPFRALMELVSNR